MKSGVSRRRSRFRRCLVFLAAVSIPVVVPSVVPAHTDPVEGKSSSALGELVPSWSDEDIEVLRSLWIGSLPPLPLDPSNRYAGSRKAAELGQRFFFDASFSANGKISCASCHIPQLDFNDALPVAFGMGRTSRRSMPLAGMGYLSWFFWDGRKDSLWSQALGPPESSAEHGISRTRCAHIISDHYKAAYEEVFGVLPEFPLDVCPPIARPDPLDEEAFQAWVGMPVRKREEVSRVFANMGKAVAAFVRLIVPGPSRFDFYVEKIMAGDREAAGRILTSEETAGLKLFIGEAECTGCHNGPLFSNGDFHRVGVPSPEGQPPDKGRSEGMTLVRQDEFNCLGPFSDAGPGDCAELKYMDTDVSKYEGAFKTPSLRNVASRPPYMHAGQISSLRELLRFYRDEAEGDEIMHRDLTDKQLEQLEAFLGTLSGPVTVNWSSLDKGKGEK